MRRAGADLIRCSAIQRCVNALSVAVIPVLLKFSLQVRGVPEQDAVEILPPDRSDKPFHKDASEARMADF